MFLRRFFGVKSTKTAVFVFLSKENRTKSTKQSKFVLLNGKYEVSYRRVDVLNENPNRVNKVDKKKDADPKISIPYFHIN